MRTADQIELDNLIRELYRWGSRRDSFGLNHLLERIVERFKCSSTGIISTAKSGQPPTLADHYGIDSAHVKNYNDYYNLLDPTLAVLQFKPLQVTPDHVTDRNTPIGNNKWYEFVNDFIKPQKTSFTAAINITSSLDGNIRAWIWTRIKNQGPFIANELTQLEMIGFHLSNIYAQKELLKKGIAKNPLCPQDFVKRFNCTKRQAEIAHAVCTSNLILEEIAEKFNIDVTCVKSHLTPVYQAAGVKRRGLTAMMLGLPVEF